MTKKLTPWKKQINQVVRDIEAGKIIYDSNFYLVDCDGLTMHALGPFLPVSYYSAWMELQTIVHGFEKYNGKIPFEVLLDSATKKERKRLLDPESEFYGIG